MVRARIREDEGLAAVCRRFWGCRWRPAVAVVSEMARRGHGKRRSRTGHWREFAGTFSWRGRWSTGGRAPSGWEWQGAQPCQGATELGFPGPALWQMQGEAACRAGEPSGQGEDPSSEGLGGHGLLTQAAPRRPAGQVMRHHLNRQPSAVGGEAPRRHVVQPDTVLEVSDGVLDLGVAAMTGLQFQRLPIAAGDEGVIAVGGEEGQLGTGRGLHTPDNEPHRCGVGLALEGSVELVSEVISRTNVVIRTASICGRLLMGNTILSPISPIVRMSF